MRTHVQLHHCIRLAGLCAGVASSVAIAGNSFEFDLAAITGEADSEHSDPQFMGTANNVTFAKFGAPVISEFGVIAFHASRNISPLGTRNGIWWRNVHSTDIMLNDYVIRIASDGDATPTTQLGSYLSAFSAPVVNDLGLVAFIGKHSANLNCPSNTQQSMWIWKQTPLISDDLVASTGINPVQNTDFYYFGNTEQVPAQTPLASLAFEPDSTGMLGDEVTFYTASGCGAGSNNIKAIWVRNHTAVLLHNPNAAATHPTHEVDTPDPNCHYINEVIGNPYGWPGINEQGHIALCLSITDLTTAKTGILSEGTPTSASYTNAGKKRIIAKVGDAAPGGGTIVDLQSSVSIQQDGKSVFRGVVDDGANDDTVLFHHAPSDGFGTLSEVRRAGDGDFTEFGMPVINAGGEIATLAKDNNGKWGVWTFVPDGMGGWDEYLHAVEGEAYQFGASPFASFHPPFINSEGEVVFLAEHDNASRTIWIANRNCRDLIVETDDELSFSDVSDLPTSAALNPGMGTLYTVTNLKLGFNDTLIMNPNPAPGTLDPSGGVGGFSDIAVLEGLSSGNADGRRSPVTDPDTSTPTTRIAIWVELDSPSTGTHEAIIVASRDLCEVNEQCPADFDGDGNVDSVDQTFLLGSWGPCGVCACCPADLNDDFVVNSLDLTLLLGSWGTCP